MPEDASETEGLITTLMDDQGNAVRLIYGVFPPATLLHLALQQITVLDQSNQKARVLHFQNSVRIGDHRIDVDSWNPNNRSYQISAVIRRRQQPQKVEGQSEVWKQVRAKQTLAQRR